MGRLSRGWLRIGCALGAGALAAPAAAQNVELPPRTLVLVVAGWCAPCHGELAALDGIAAAAPGLAVRVVGLDETRATRAMLAAVSPERRWRPSSVDLARLRSFVFAESAGLPYAFVTDARGRSCADSRLPLDGARTRALVRRCAG